jgi:uncharacterized protein (TIGR02147 family)
MDQSESVPAKLSIFDYDDFRKYLRDVYLSSKATHSKFSFRFFAKAAGFASPSALKRVIDGERNLSLEGIRKFSTALKLPKEESLFFHNLVLLNQAKSSEDKQLYAEQLLASRQYKKLHPLQNSQFNYFSKWYFIPIRELISLPAFREDPEWIAKKLSPTVSIPEIKSALEDLLKLGLVKRDAAGKLQQTDASITANGLVSPALSSFHKQMTVKASESIDRFPREVREISSLTSAVSESAFEKIKEIILKCRNEIIGVITDDQNQDRIYQVNFYLFPLSTKIRDEKE